LNRSSAPTTALKLKSMNPDEAFEHWFESMPAAHRGKLCMLFFFLTGERTDDFFLSDQEALRRFSLFCSRPDFPVRRVARLLLIRAVFSFVLRSEDVERFLELIPGSMRSDVVPIEGLQWLRTLRAWEQLCKTGLSDESLYRWLESIQ